jgi:hypothetical protein
MKNCNFIIKGRFEKDNHFPRARRCACTLHHLCLGLVLILSIYDFGSFSTIFFGAIRRAEAFFRQSD